MFDQGPPSNRRVCRHMLLLSLNHTGPYCQVSQHPIKLNSIGMRHIVRKLALS